MSKDNNEKKMSDAEKAINAVTAGIRSFEDYNFLIFDRAMYESKKPLDIANPSGETLDKKNDPFQTKVWLTKLTTSETEESAITKKNLFKHI